MRVGKSKDGKKFGRKRGRRRSSLVGRSIHRLVGDEESERGRARIKIIIFHVVEVSW